MPQITAIKPQVKREGRYNIFVDGVYRFPLSELGLIAAGIRVGQDLDESELEALEQTSLRAKAMERVQNFLSFRPRSSYEVRTYLHKKEYDEELITQVVAEFERLNLLNDDEFARSWVRSRNSVKHRSQRILRQELMQKGILREIIDTVLSEEGDESELINLREVLMKKIDQPAYADRSKLLRYLASKGFNYTDIKRVIEELGSEDYLNSDTDNDNP